MTHDQIISVLAPKINLLHRQRRTFESIHALVPDAHRLHVAKALEKMGWQRRLAKVDGKTIYSMSYALKRDSGLQAIEDQIHRIL